MVRMFKPQFAALVESGTKRQTVRPKPKRIPKPGQPISLRTWTGLPYRSKQRVLREATVTRVDPVTMALGPAHQLLLSVGGGTVDEAAFARADGFQSIEEMRDWFKNTHGLPFEGIVIHW
jgi:hypothetical protein